uniref:Macaca fascicularis brain cDNA clone: QflA-23625, similar to human Nanog homeobox (NANOG), mRNA, RefSeq: NM_024865.1 n=1 Tax=Macaca fascicularis TaxID=9541 RepID=I7GDT1_MACFA|nr:unnamed protein product [Macaca fascicularis]
MRLPACSFMSSLVYIYPALTVTLMKPKHF